MTNIAKNINTQRQLVRDIRTRIKATAQVKILTAVGKAIVAVILLKYVRASISKPTANI